MNAHVGFRRWLTARHMALSGYATKIITTEAGVTYKQLRGIYKELEEDGFEREQAKSRRLRGSGAILRTNELRRQAAYLIQVYRNIGGDDVFLSVNVNALNKAYRIYRSSFRELDDLPCSAHGSKGPITITEAWCLVKELREATGELFECETCKATYFSSAEEKDAYICPFCFPNGRNDTGKQKSY